MHTRKVVMLRRKKLLLFFAGVLFFSLFLFYKQQNHETFLHNSSSRLRAKSSSPKYFISYCYFERDLTALHNFLYFLKHTLVVSEDFHFAIGILGHHSSIKIPQGAFPSIQTFKLPNYGHHLCCHKHILSSVSEETKKNFSHFLFLSSNLRGPVVMEEQADHNTANLVEQRYSKQNETSDQLSFFRLDPQTGVIELKFLDKPNNTQDLFFEPKRDNTRENFNHVWLSILKNKLVGKRMISSLPHCVFSASSKQRDSQHPYLSTDLLFLDYGSLHMLQGKLKCVKSGHEMREKVQREISELFLSVDSSSLDCLSTICQRYDWAIHRRKKSAQCNSEEEVKIRNEDGLVFYEIHQALTNKKVLKKFGDDEVHSFYERQYKHSNLVVFLIRTFKGHHKHPFYSLEKCLRSLIELKEKNWLAFVANTDEQDFPEMEETIMSINDTRIMPSIFDQAKRKQGDKLDSLLSKFSKSNKREKYSKFESAYHFTDDLVYAHWEHLLNQFKSAARPEYPRWMVVTNGDNTYMPDFLSKLDQNFDMLGFSFYSRHVGFNQQDRPKINLLKVGDTDLGSNILNYGRFVEEERRFSDYLPHGSQDGVMIEALKRDGWKPKIFTETQFSHNPNLWSCRHSDGERYINVPADSKCVTVQEADAFKSKHSDAYDCSLFGFPSVCITEGGSLFNQLVNNAVEETKQICKMELEKKRDEDVSGIPIENMAHNCPDMYGDLDPKYYNIHSGQDYP